MTSVVGLLVSALIAASPVDGKRVAVLEFTNATKRQLSSLDAMTDEARGGAAALLSPQGAMVLTKENMLEVLKLTGGVCREGECEVETARNLNVDLFVVGTLSEADGALLLTLKLFETRKGELKLQQLLEARTELELVKMVKSSTTNLLAAGLSLGARRRTGTTGMGEARIAGPGGFEIADEQSAVCQFESKPSGAVVMLDGVLLCKETPCSRPIPMGAHTVSMALEDYDEARGSIMVSPSSRRFSLSLPPSFGTISADVVPREVSLRLDGAGVTLESIGKLKVSPGEHELVVENQCFERTGQRFVIEKGAVRRLAISAEPRMAALKVKTIDGKGNSVAGEVVADGKRVGETWKPIKLPLCTKSLMVRTSEGDEVVFSAELSERTVREVEVEVLDLLQDPMLNVSPSRRADLRMQVWERRMAPARERAARYTIAAFGAGALTLGAAAAWQFNSSARESAERAYSLATSDHDALYGQYVQAYWGTMIAGPTALIGLATTGWLGWSAWSAWNDLPVRPAFVSTGDSHTFVLEGMLP